MKDEIDPQIPYIQVHRSVARMAAQLAEPLGLTYQHVRGSLDVFWESLADRRVLAKALALPEPMVLLDAAEATNRLWLAFGRQVELALVVAAGVLEPVEAKYRVRGMSRYVEMEAERLAALARSTAGGRSRAVGVRLASGRFAAGVPAGERLDAPPASHQPAASQSPATHHVRGERREVRVETGEVRGDIRTPPGFVVSEPTTPADAWTADDFWRWAQSRRQKAGFIAEKHPGVELSGWYSQTLAGLNGDIDRLKEAFLSFGDSPYWQKPKEPPPLPFRGFMSQVDRFIPRSRDAS